MCHTLGQARESRPAAPAMASEHDQAGADAAGRCGQAVDRSSTDADDHRIMAGDAENVGRLLGEGAPEAEIGSTCMRENHPGIVARGDGGPDQGGMAVLDALGPDQHDSGKAELGTCAGRQDRHEGTVHGTRGGAAEQRARHGRPVVGADHQQAGVARGLHDRVAHVVRSRDYGGGLDAVGVGRRARRVDRHDRVFLVELPGGRGPVAARVGYRDEGERVERSHELNGLVQGLMPAGRPVDRADDLPERERRTDAGIDAVEDR